MVEQAGGAPRPAAGQRGALSPPRLNDDSPFSLLHQRLTSENHQHVNAAVVEDIGPVADHPPPRVLVNEIIFKVEDVGVIWDNFHIHFVVVVVVFTSAILLINSLKINFTTTQRFSNFSSYFFYQKLFLFKRLYYT